MRKSTRITLWFSCVLVFLAVATWFYYDRSKQQTLLNQADQTIETGIALFKAKEYPEALAVFANIPPGTPLEWYTRYYQGSTYIMLKDYSTAVTYLERALVLNPSDTQIMHALGVAYYKMGNLKMSKAYFASVLEINPDDGEARGLMEVMTNLERQQPEHTEVSAKNKKTNGQ